MGQKYCRVLSGTFSRLILELKKVIIRYHLSSFILSLPRFYFQIDTLSIDQSPTFKTFWLSNRFQFGQNSQNIFRIEFLSKQAASAKKNPSHVRYQHTTDLLAAPNRREKSRRPNPEPYTRSRFHKNTLLTFTVHSLDVIHASSSSAPVASSPTFAAMPKPTSQNSPRPTYCS